MHPHIQEIKALLIHCAFFSSQQPNPKLIAMAREICESSISFALSNRSTSEHLLWCAWLDLINKKDWEKIRQSVLASGPQAKSMRMTSPFSCWLSEDQADWVEAHLRDYFSYDSLHTTASVIPQVTEPAFHLINPAGRFCYLSIVWVEGGYITALDEFGEAGGFDRKYPDAYALDLENSLQVIEDVRADLARQGCLFI